MSDPDEVLDSEGAEEVPEDLTGGLSEPELDAGYAIQVRILHLETNTVVGEAISRGVRPDLLTGPKNMVAYQDAYDRLVLKVGAEVYGKAFVREE